MKTRASDEIAFFDFINLSATSLTKPGIENESGNPAISWLATYRPKTERIARNQLVSKQICIQVPRTKDIELLKRTMTAEWRMPID